MADNEQDTDTSVDVEAEAREMGWVDKSEFRGDPEKWVPAEQFVEHGRHVMPILRKNNERLLADQQTMKAQLRQLTAELEAAKEDFSTLEEFHNEEVTRRVEETRKELLTQIKAAKREGDVDTEVDLTDQLQRLNSANTDAEDEIADGERKNGKQAKTVETTLTPEYLEWKANNDWFESDPERTYGAMAVATRVTKERPELRGKAFFAEVDKRLNSRSGRPGPSKVEGSRGGASRGGGEGHTYADLDADAKAQCDKFAKKFVKANGKFKTEAEYRKHYINELESTGYFTGDR